MSTERGPRGQQFVFEKEQLKIAFSLYVDTEGKIIHLLDLHQEGTLWLVNTLDEDFLAMVRRELSEIYGTICLADYRWFIYEPVRIFQYKSDEEEFCRKFVDLNRSDELYQPFVEQVNIVSN